MVNRARPRSNAVPNAVSPTVSNSEWDRIANSRKFKDLMATKKIFIVPAFIFFIVYYFALPILVGYAPALHVHSGDWRGEPGLSVRSCPSSSWPGSSPAFMSKPRTTLTASRKTSSKMPSTGKGGK